MYLFNETMRFCVRSYFLGRQKTWHTCTHKCTVRGGHKGRASCATAVVPWLPRSRELESLSDGLIHTQCSSSRDKSSIVGVSIVLLRLGGKRFRGYLPARATFDDHSKHHGARPGPELAPRVFNVAYINKYSVVLGVLRDVW